jgi:hypothetical protein
MRYSLSQIATFIKSLFFHIGAGFPKSSQETINYRYSICEQCDSFDKIESQCIECGCNINKRRIFLNKLAWLDQQCPLNKWFKNEQIKKSNK